jgi:purine-binding chemotaxis protein CheW
MALQETGEGSLVTKQGQSGDKEMRLVVFRIDEQRYGLYLPAVDRTLRAVRVTPLPHAPVIILGVIDVAGRVIPVVNMRARFGVAERDLRLGDALILARTPQRTVALAADTVEGLWEGPLRQMQSADSIFPEIPGLEGVARMEDGLILIHDLALLLSLDEEKELDAAMTSATPQR